MKELKELNQLLEQHTLHKDGFCCPNCGKEGCEPYIRDRKKVYFRCVNKKCIQETFSATLQSHFKCKHEGCNNSCYSNFLCRKHINQRNYKKRQLAKLNNRPVGKTTYV